MPSSLDAATTGYTGSGKWGPGQAREVAGTANVHRGWARGGRLGILDGGGGVSGVAGGGLPSHVGGDVQQTQGRPMKSQIRTFVAVEMSPDVRSRAGELIEELRAAPVKVKWVDPKNMHLTLKFLGDVDAREIPRVCEKVIEAAAEVAPFELEIAGAGAFPHAGRPSTVWLGVTKGTEEIIALQELVEAGLAELGFRAESRRFEPHLTIGRVRRGTRAVGELGRLIRDHADFPAGRVAVKEAVVFSSDLQPTGPTYQALGRAPLGKKS